MIVHLFFSSRRRHTRWPRDWSSDVCSSDLKAQGELARVAARLGLSLGEFNMLLALNSRLGLAVAGTTYDPDTGTVEGFASRRTLAGLGLLGDVNDTLLNIQGLLDAVSLSVVADLPANGHLQGHSLGAWRVNNLVRQGYLQSGDLRSLPGLTHPAAGTGGVCSNFDIICGGLLLTPIRSGTETTASPTWWSWFNRNHRICTVSGYQEGWGGTCD